MSGEVLLFALVALAGLVEWALRLRREWAKRQPPAGHGQAQPQSQPPQPAQAEPPDSWWGQAPSAPIPPAEMPPRDTRERVRSADRPRPALDARRRSGTGVSSASGARNAPASLARIGTPRDLRRTVVLMTVLGPCRAEHPHAWPDKGR